MTPAVLEKCSRFEAMERSWGNPAVPTGALSFKRSVELDEREEFPEEACAFLQRWGLPEYFIPAEEGGKLESFEDAVLILRLLARRDLTAAIALGQIYLGAVHVWIRGSKDQKRRVAELIRANQFLAFALTERQHGSDILASECQALPATAGYLLGGEKWLINNGSRAAAVTVFARTNLDGGPRGFSVFLVEKEKLERSRYGHLPKAKTHGIRGADISGIRFRDCPIPADACIGLPGSGFETALLGLIVTRTLCAGFSLGAADTALRATLEFALERRIYGDTVFNIPYARRSIANAFLDLLICDCVALAAARGLHVIPEQFSVWSAITKYFVPTLAENLIHDLSVVLGARHYLREGVMWGVFEKMMRDGSVVSLFDGSTVVNLNAIVLQLPYLLAQHDTITGMRRDQIGGHLEKVAGIAQPLPSFDAARLDLFSHGRDDMLQGLELAFELFPSRELVRDVPMEIISCLTREVLEEANAVRAMARDTMAASGRKAGFKSPEMFEAARRYCFLHAAAACIFIWVHNRVALGDYFSRGEWLALCVDRLLRRLGRPRQPPPASWFEAAAAHLLGLHREGRLFSIVPFRVAAGVK